MTLLITVKILYFTKNIVFKHKKAMKIHISKINTSSVFIKWIEYGLY